MSHASMAEALLAFAEARGLKRPDLRVQEFDGRGLGLVAARAFEAGETLLEVPDALLITTRLAEGAGLSPLARLVLFLVRERRLGPASQWAPYIACLPKAYDSAAFWTDAELASLGDEFAAARLRGAAADAERVVAEVERHAREAPESVPGGAEGLAGEARWAWATVMSRGLYLDVEGGAAWGDKYALAPVGDLFNFGPGESEGAHDAAAGCYRFVARRRYGAGEEVLLSYGRHANLALVETYGFSLPPGANPDDTLDLTGLLARRASGGGLLPFVQREIEAAGAAARGKAPRRGTERAREAQDGSEELAALKAQTLFEAGLAAGHEVLGTGEASHSLRAALRISAMSHEEHAAAYVALQDRPISARCEAAAEELLAALCEEALAALEAAPAWPAGSPASRGAAAAAWRAGQAAIARRALELARDRLLAVLTEATLAASPASRVPRLHAPAGEKKKGGHHAHGPGCGCGPGRGAGKGRPTR